MVDGKYLGDEGEIHPIRLDSLRYAAGGTPPTGAVDSSIKVKISKSNREFGVRPRSVTLVRTVGTAPDTFRKYSDLPVMTPTDFSSPAFAIGGTITIDGIIWVIIGKKPEDY